MKLVVQEVIETDPNPHYQEFAATKDAYIEVIRPRIYKHNEPAGTLYLYITDEIGNFIAQSDEVTITDISDLPFAHKFVKFPIRFAVKSGQVFRMFLRSNGYTYVNSAYAGWCKTLGNEKYPINYVPAIGMSSPLDFEVWSREVL